MLIGYARVSTEDQNLDLQRDALRRVGCKKIFEEKEAGRAAIPCETPGRNLEGVVTFQVGRPFRAEPGAFKTRYLLRLCTLLF